MSRPGGEDVVGAQVAWDTLAPVAVVPAGDGPRRPVYLVEATGDRLVAVNAVGSHPGLLEERDGVQVLSASMAKSLGFAAKPGELALVTADRPAVLVGLGGPGPQLPGTAVYRERPDDSPLHLTDRARKAGAVLARGCARVESALSLRFPGSWSAEQVRHALEGYLLGAYVQPRWSREERPARANTLEVSSAGGMELDPLLAQARINAWAAALARDLTNTPSNIKNPQWMAERAREAVEPLGCSVEVWDVEELERRGFGGHLAVGGASATPPRCVRISYAPEGADRHVVLVGKGITFDTGGLAIKPRISMQDMKTDMGGSAAVLAAVAGAARGKLDVAVTAFLCLAENAVGAGAYRPGDIVRCHGGTTVEIGNPDAEGRMVMADALSWARENLEFDHLVDVATLTGAASRTFGADYSALFSTDEELARELLAAGDRTGEWAWPMPLPADYRAGIDSDVADLAQVNYTMGAGSVMAAMFLREFAGGGSWAHLDIAGPAHRKAADAEFPAGATGVGARLVLDFLHGCQ